MHYLQLFITKHEDSEFVKDDAETQIDNFLEAYQDVEWDWYVFGGRWEGLFDGRLTVPYKEALPKLKEMLENREQELEEKKERVLQAINGTSNDKFMDGYYVKNYGLLLGKYYTGDVLFYNMEYGGAFKLPEESEDLSQYYVTIVDIHN